MTENNQGKVVPFALTATRVRRRAEEHARRGRVLEAIELYRRAAQEDEMPTGWLYLARLLRSNACYEQAMRVLYRMICRGDVPPDAWLELAKCQRALDMREGVQDSLYHLLDEDPYSDSADEARDMLAQMDGEDLPKEPFRLPVISRRAMAAWRQGEWKLAERRFRRVAKLSKQPGGVYATLAMLSLTSPKPQTALVYAARAMRLEPHNIRVRTMAAVCFAMQGKKRYAQALLEKCIPDVRTVSEENAVMTALDSLSMKALKQRFTEARRKITPYRAELLRLAADMAAAKGDLDSAAKLWNTMLRIDPQDTMAQAMLRLAQQEPEHIEAGSHPEQIKRRMEARLAAIVFQRPTEEQLAPGSETRMAVDWCVAQENHVFCKLVLKSIVLTELPAAQEYLNELLTSPHVCHEARNELMELLAEAGRLEQRQVLMGQCIALAQAAQRQDAPYAAEKRFLMLVMLETKKHRMTAQMVEFAAEAWRCMTNRMRRDAVGRSSYAYVKAVEIIRLRLAGREDDVRRTVRDLNVSHRRIGRVITKLVRAGAVEVTDEGETDDEMYQF